MMYYDYLIHFIKVYIVVLLGIVTLALGAIPVNHDHAIVDQEESALLLTEEKIEEDAAITGSEDKTLKSANNFLRYYSTTYSRVSANHQYSRVSSLLKKIFGILIFFKIH